MISSSTLPTLACPYCRRQFTWTPQKPGTRTLVKCPQRNVVDWEWQMYSGNGQCWVERYPLTHPMVTGCGRWFVVRQMD